MLNIKMMNDSNVVYIDRRVVTNHLKTTSMCSKASNLDISACPKTHPIHDFDCRYSLKYVSKVLYIKTKAQIDVSDTYSHLCPIVDNTTSTSQLRITQLMERKITTICVNGGSKSWILLHRFVSCWTPSHRWPFWKVLISTYWFNWRISLEGWSYFLNKNISSNVRWLMI